MGALCAFLLFALTTDVLFTWYKDSCFMFNFKNLKPMGTKGAGLLAAAALLLSPALALAETAAPAASTINSGDTAWMLVSTALVLLMVPGLAFFYAGMVRSKNVVSTLFQNMMSISVVGLLWVAIGFSLAFVGDHGGFIGTTAAFMLKGIGQNPDGAATIPHLLFMAFQMMFAIITPALITGAFAERVNFKAWILFSALWSLAVYVPVAHWVWSPTGWLFGLGALDFAGGFVVHMTAGFSALVAALMFGKRRDFGEAQRPYDVGMITLGTALLLFGWLGFNGGSALTSGGLAVQAVVNSVVAAAAAFLMWSATDSFKDGKPTLVGACIGLVAGLVAITPASGYVSVPAAMVIGSVTGVVCNLVARFIKGKGIDDTLDVFACHGVGGTIGAIATGLFASTVINPAGAKGLLYGGSALLNANLTGALAVAAYSVAVTFVLFKVVGAVTPLRVTDSEEALGLDEALHGEQINGLFANATPSLEAGSTSKASVDSIVMLNTSGANHEAPVETSVN
jgi:ammonium transporter, Amt family